MDLKAKIEWALDELESLEESYNFAGLPYEDLEYVQDEVRCAEGVEELQKIIDTEQEGLELTLSERNYEDLLNSHPNRDFL